MSVDGLRDLQQDVSIAKDKNMNTYDLGFGDLSTSILPFKGEDIAVCLQDFVVQSTGIDIC